MNAKSVVENKTKQSDMKIKLAMINLFLIVLVFLTGCRSPVKIIETYEFPIFDVNHVISIARLEASERLGGLSTDSLSPQMVSYHYSADIFDGRDLLDDFTVYLRLPKPSDDLSDFSVHWKEDYRLCVWMDMHGNIEEQGVTMEGGAESVVVPSRKVGSYSSQSDNLSSFNLPDREILINIARSIAEQQVGVIHDDLILYELVYHIPIGSLAKDVGGTLCLVQFWVKSTMETEYTGYKGYTVEKKFDSVSVAFSPSNLQKEANVSVNKEYLRRVIIKK